MKVFKFGGASIKSATAIQNVATIIQKYNEGELLVVISALDKTTNNLEAVLHAYWNKNKKECTDALNKVKEQHLGIMQMLFEASAPVFDVVNDIFIDLEWILEEEPQEEFDYLYDQIVSTGELLSTTIVAAYLNKIEVATTWLDVRDCIVTDNTYRDAKVDWELTAANIKEVVPELLQKGIVLTQGFLGGTSENFTTTLGREGSDFTAAIFSYCLDAESMSIWKDVPGVLAGDPRLFDDMPKLDKVSYKEAIEMTYYGAQVIHPKTIQPLQNKKIQLHVKSFVNPEGAGTVIGEFEQIDYPPIIVVKNNQALLKINSKDFHFVDEAKFSALFAALAAHRIKVNMTQNTALAFSVCVNDDAEKIDRLTKSLADNYEVEKKSDLKLLTVRYATDDVLDKFSKGRKIYLEERIRKNTQLVLNQEEVL